MKNLKLCAQYILLATMPSLCASPGNTFSHAVSQRVCYRCLQETEEWVRPKTYDEIIQMLEDLESGDLERRYQPEQLERVNEYLVTLAKEGILPDEFDEKTVLEKDSCDLIHGKDSAFELIRYLENNNEYMIIPAIFNSYSVYNIVQCGKISKAWEKTKKFVKKHKKEIIIGAAVVVAVTVVVVAVVAASAAAGASGVAIGSAAGSSDPGHSESKKSESKEETSTFSATSKETPPPINTNEAPLMKAAIDEHVASFKGFLVEDKAAQQATSPKGWDEMSLGEKAKEVGSGFAHQAYDEIVDLVKIVPQLCEEVKELSSKFLPDSLIPSNNRGMGSPMENYENIVANGHEVIDHAFSTDQAELFTAEAKANNPMNDFAIGFLPPPGVVFKTFSDTSKFARAGKAFDRAGYTKAGRNLMKHGYRESSAFPKPLGNPAQVNAHGQEILESIINHPERVIYERPHPDFGKVIDVVVPDKWGARFSIKGEMIGFLEP